MKKRATSLPGQPTPRQRVQWSTESLARDLTDAHPRVQALRREYARTLQRSVNAALRGWGKGRKI